MMRPRLKMPEVTVFGAGIFGLSIAWACLGKGADVTVIDPHGPGAGASGGILGAMVPHVPENWNKKKAFQFRSLLLAESFWSDVDAVSGISSGYGRYGRLQPINDLAALELARKRVESSAILWEGRAFWDVVASPQKSDFTPLAETGYVIEDTLSARINPRKAIESLAAAIRSRGGIITRWGSPRGQVVHATGVAGLMALSREIGCSVGGAVKGQVALLEYSAAVQPQIFADSIHVVPHKNGTVAVGSTSEREFSDSIGTDARLDRIIDSAVRVVPALKNARVVERWAGLRPRTRSRAPMLGSHPVREGEFIANGGFKIGFGMATGVAKAMADLVIDEIDAIPDEFKPEASFS